MTIVALTSFGLLIGFLIGFMGIGGVLLSPALIYCLGMESHDAVSLTLASFVPAGAVALIAGLRRAEIFSKRDWQLLGAIVPGAAVGTVALHTVSDQFLSIVISLSVATTGLWNVFRRSVPSSHDVCLGNKMVIGIGFVAGVVSAMTGTGGPLVLLPLLIWAGVNIRHALALALPAQLPVSLTATIANAAVATVDLKAALVLGGAITLGLLVGKRASSRVDQKRLARAVAWCLLGIGLTLSIVGMRKLLT